MALSATYSRPPLSPTRWPVAGGTLYSPTFTRQCIPPTVGKALRKNGGANADADAEARVKDAEERAARYEAEYKKAKKEAKAAKAGEQKAKTAAAEDMREGPRVKKAQERAKAAIEVAVLDAKVCLLTRECTWAQNKSPNQRARELYTAFPSTHTKQLIDDSNCLVN